MSDLYGTDVLLTDSGDFAVTPSGDLALISGPLNCGQALVQQLRTYPGDLALHPDYGSLLLEAIGAKGLDDGLVATVAGSTLRRALESDRRFLAVRDLTAVTDPAAPGRTAVSATVVLASGDTLQVGSLAEPRVDEISIDAPPTLAALSDGALDTLDTLDFVVDDDTDADFDLEGLIGQDFTLAPDLSADG